MKAIVFSSIKGGTGKTSLSILTANCLAANDQKVLVIDMDIQNSLSFYYMQGDDQGKNIAFGLQTDLQKNICKTEKANIDIIPSSFLLADLRAISVNKLKKQLAELESAYDFVIIDTAPTYDNIVLNAINAADILVTPVLLSQFDFKGAKFYEEKLLSETDKYNCWYLVINNYASQYEDNPHSAVSEYLKLFTVHFENILDVKIPRSSFIQKHIDTNEVLSNAKQKEKLYSSVTEFVSSVSDKELVRRMF